MQRLVRQCVAAVLIAGLAPIATAYSSAATTTEAAMAVYAAGHIEEAAVLFERAARAGNRLAQFHYAMLLRRGEASSPESNAVWRWLRRSAEAGFPHAQYELARLYEEGAGRVRQSDGVAAEWYRRAAKQGHPDAQYRLATLQLDGIDIPDDALAAIRWLQAAARAGHVGAKRRLAQLYESGHGVDRDPERAAHWYRQAGLHGDSEDDEQ